MATSNKPARSLIGALEDHSDEGIGILTATPARLTHVAIYVMVALVLAGLAWSFFGRADVLVMAPGTLVPASEVRRLYAPIDGELANIYIAEGQPVLKGDVVARLYARGAIEAARNALEARLKLEDAEREWKEFPQKKALLDERVAALKEAMDTEERQHERRQAEDVGVPLQHPVVADHDDDGDGADDRDRRPDDLLDPVRLPAGHLVVDVDAVDLGDPDPGEDRRDGQQERVGLRRNEPEGDVHPDHERREARAVVDEREVDVPLRAELDEHDGGGVDAARDDQQEQLEVAELRWQAQPFDRTGLRPGLTALCHMTSGRHRSTDPRSLGPRRGRPR